MQIKATKLSKRFEETIAVDNLSLETRSGYVLGILGLAKSGKTTTLRMLLHLIKPDSGTVRFDDRPINSKIRNQIGYLAQNRGVYPEVSVQELLIHFARLKGLSRKKAQVESVRLLDRFEMIDCMEKRLGDLPVELQEKVQIMAAIIHNPEFLIFDDPFLDTAPGNQDLVRKLIQRFRDEGKTIILATRHMNEVETLCDEIIFMNEGKTILQDNLRRIWERFQENMILVESESHLPALKDISGVNKVIKDGKQARLFISSSVSPQKIAEQLLKRIEIQRLEINRPRLQDIFLEIMQDQQGAEA